MGEKRDSAEVSAQRGRVKRLRRRTERNMGWWRAYCGSEVGCCEKMSELRGELRDGACLGGR